MPNQLKKAFFKIPMSLDGLYPFFLSLYGDQKMVLIFWFFWGVGGFKAQKQ